MLLQVSLVEACLLEAGLAADYGSEVHPGYQRFLLSTCAYCSLSIRIKDDATIGVDIRSKCIEL